MHILTLNPSSDSGEPVPHSLEHACTPSVKNHVLFEQYVLKNTCLKDTLADLVVICSLCFQKICQNGRPGGREPARSISFDETKRKTSHVVFFLFFGKKWWCRGLLGGSAPQTPGPPVSAQHWVEILEHLYFFCKTKSARY